MLLLDLDLGRAEQVASAHGGGKARAARVDARAADRSAGFPGRDARGMRRSGQLGELPGQPGGDGRLSRGGMPLPRPRRPLLDDRLASSSSRPSSRAAGLLALLGIGSAPGKTNLMAETAVRQLGAVRALSERRRGTGSTRCTSSRPGAISIRRRVQRSLRASDPARRARRCGRGPARRPPARRSSRSRMVESSTSASRSATGRRSTRCTPSSTRSARASAAARRAFGSACRPTCSPSFGIWSAPPRPKFSAEQPRRSRPRDGRSRCTSSRRWPESARSRVRAITEPIEAWGLGGGIVSTAAPVAAAVRLLARGAIEPAGRPPPERCIDPADMFAELERRGCRFEVTTPEEVRA